MKNSKITLAKLFTLKKSILADGRVDWDETETLLKALRPLADKEGFLIEDFENLLQKCRADGKITAEESAKLAAQLDLLCRTFARRRHWNILIVFASCLLFLVFILFLIDIIHLLTAS